MSLIRYIALDENAVGIFEQYKADHPEMMPRSGANVIAVYYQTGGFYVIAEELMNAPQFQTLRQGLQDAGLLDNLTIVELDPADLYPEDE